MTIKLKKDDIQLTDQAAREHLLFSAAMMQTLKDSIRNIDKVFAISSIEMIESLMEEDGKTTGEVLTENLRACREATKEMVQELMQNQLDIIHDLHPELHKFKFTLKVEGPKDKPFDLSVVDITELDDVEH